MDAWASRTPGGEGVLLRLRVVPGASGNAVVGPHGDRLRVRVAAPAERGRANRALLALLAERLGLPPTALRLVHGAAAPLKTVLIAGLAAEEAVRRLAGGSP